MTPNARSTLLVVDMQYDFLPDGALGVAGGDTIVSPITELMLSARFDFVVVTQDWHPPGHISFASSHPGREPFESISLYDRPQVLWPDHCVAGSRGAELHDEMPWHRARAIIRKGSEPDVDSYSALRNNWDRHGQRPPTGLGGYLADCGVTDVFICGLARDYCVKWTAEDAADLGFRVHVFWELTRAVDAADDETVRAALVGRGVEILEGETGHG